MVGNNIGLHHLSKRKRISQKHEQYPSPNKLKRFLDKIIYVVVFGGIIMTVPQVVKIWADKSAEGLSIVTWISYLVFSAVWFFYGVLHNDKPIIIGNFFWIIFDVLIVLGIVLYG
ncbi:MAG: SemiSWEET family transporter [archaeon]